MNHISVDFLLDLFLVGLLLATIGYCAILNKRLKSMRGAHQELRELSAAFDQAIVRSRLGVDELKVAAEGAGKNIKAEIGQAQELIEELQLINASSTRIADRLQSSVQTTSASIPKAAYADDPAGLFEDDGFSEEKPTEEPRAFRTEAEKELFEMLSKAN